MLQSPMGDGAAAALDLGQDCVRHSMLFFNRPEQDLAAAKPGTFTLMPVGDMYDRLRADYQAMAVMIFGEAPPFEAITASIQKLEALLNG